MIFKFILVAGLFFIMASLFSALYFLIKDPSSSKRTVKTLFIRVLLSLSLLLLLFIGSQLGWVQPHDFGQ